MTTQWLRPYCWWIGKIAASPRGIWNWKVVTQCQNKVHYDGQWDESPNGKIQGISKQ